MLAELATNPDDRLYNKRLAAELSELARLEREKAKRLAIPNRVSGRKP